MLRGLFVTGTDTGVGKTVVAAALVHRYRGVASLRYWKPIQTGIEQDDDTATVRALGECRDEEIHDAGVRLPRPVSPHLAARLNGQQIEIESLVGPIAQQSANLRWIAEGAGGALVPINDTQKMTDLVAALGLPALVVSRSALGTINHTLLTLEALRNRDISVAGVVMVGEPNGENRFAIEEFGGVRVVGEMPPLVPLTADNVAAWAREKLDPAGELLELFDG